MEFSHVPVLYNETVSALKIRQNGFYIDCTAGGGGHSAGILERLGSEGRLLLIDRDPDAAERLNERFGRDDRVRVINDNFVNIREIFTKISAGQADGILADLGVSSYQLDHRERGFSFHSDGPLDMRMSKSGLSADDVINTYSEDRLRKIITVYGEEKFAGRIAKEIVRARTTSEIKTTLRLSEVIKSALPQAACRNGHPARKTFQAIRIEVNGELDALKNALSEMFFALNTGGVLAVITFHSLEDKIVKDYFSSLTKGCTCPPDFPVCICGKTPKAKVKSGGTTASKEEIERNPRSRSAKLRTAIKL